MVGKKIQNEYDKCPRGEGHAFSDWKNLLSVMVK